ncbi:hypothetical protein RSAG8_04919, partial [Rhizoctonia solani AG-8 WAC10335]
MSSESGSEAESYPRVMVSLYHALLVLNTSVHASRVSHYQPSTACVISSVRTVLTATDCLHKTAPALARFPHLARARSDVLQELGRLVAVSKKASAPDVPDEERTWLAESMLRYGDAVFACCKRYVEVAISCGVHVAGRTHIQSQHELAPRLTSASASSLSSVSSSPASPEMIPSGHISSAQLLSALRTTHDHLLSIIAAFIGHVHSHSRASHASSKGHLIKMTRETVDKVRQVLTIVCAVCDHPAVVGPERVALSAAKDALHGATSVLVEAVKRMLAPGILNREEEEKALAVQAATGTLRAGGDCVTAEPAPELEYEAGNESITVQPGHGPIKIVRPTTPIREDVPDELEQHVNGDARLDEPIPEVEAPRDAVTPQPTTEDLPPTLFISTPSPHDIPLPDDAQSAVADDQVEFPVVVSATTSPACSFEREPLFRHESSTPSTLELRRSSQFTSGSLSLFESARTSEDTAATAVAPEEKTDNHLSPNGFGNEDDEVDAESLMNEPMVRGLDASSGDQAFDEDEMDRTPLPPSQSFEPPEEESDEGFRDDRDIKHRGDKSLPPDGHLMGATLDVLVETMTSHEHTPDPKFAATFFLSFRLFTTPLELVQLLHKRWDMHPPVDTFSKEEYETWCRARLDPVRWRVYNFIKLWLDLHWQIAEDSVALAPLQEFVSATASKMHPSIVQRVVDLLTQRQPSSDSQLTTSRLMGRARSVERTRAKFVGSAPTPVMSKSLFALLKSGSYASVNVVDFDALELARQFTLLESNLYCKVRPEEILDVGLPSSAGERGNSIRAMSTLSTAITGWVTEIILDEQDTKKRTGFLKLFIKVADHCGDLHNFSTLRSILAALDSSTISRLSKTWMGLSAKNKTRLENLRKLTDHTRNHCEYRARLRNIRGHAVPFLGLYLTDVTFCREGNPDKRVSPYDATRTLVNFDKYRRLAAIAEDVKRFQAPYNLIEIPEVQKYLEYAFEKVKKSGNDLHDLYRRSLLVEPRQPTDSLETKTSSIKSSELFGWASRDKS